MLTLLALVGSFDGPGALVALLVLVGFTVLVNLFVRQHVPRRERRRRRSGYGPDDLRRDGAAWNLAPGDARRSWRSQLHDRDGAGPDTVDPEGSDAGDRDRRDAGPFLG